MGHADLVLVVDLDGTLLTVNSFPRWALWLLAGRADGARPARASAAARTALLLARRRLRLIDHDRFKAGLETLWRSATAGDGGATADRFTRSLERHVRPNLRGVLADVAAGRILGVLATAASGDYAEALGARLGFRHVLAGGLGAAKRDRVLAWLAEQGHAAARIVLLTDHRDDLPLIARSAVVGWFGPDAALAAVRDAAPPVRIVACRGLDDQAIRAALLAPSIPP